MKSYTDLKQSKMLAEILPIESADMFLALNGLVPVMSKYIDNGLVTADETAIPCWSLAALLELTPNDVSLLHFEDAYQAVYDVKPYHITNKFDNPLDATFEMICWLKKYEKI